jgi:uncharacterized phage-like protein YoqJ
MITTTHIVAFTGHRTYDGSANEQLMAAISELYAQGARHFRVGMAEGFDLAAGSAVVEMMLTHSDITLEACIPWPGFEARFSAEGRTEYNRIMDYAAIVRYASDKYHRRVFYDRNDMLVEGAQSLIAWWDGGKSGTGYTVKRARKLGLIIKNLHPENQLSIAFSD